MPIQRNQSQIFSAKAQSASRLSGDAHSDEYIESFVESVRETKPPRSFSHEDE
jgi:hypothetical protein